ncbi:MAG: hypothetical protein EOP78_17190 [Variovorax sp.]|nr:MAG: hypothetical protein EOP78_17190 [Variovorax sp.]
MSTAVDRPVAGEDWVFGYRGCEFLCSVTTTGPNAFWPHVLYRGGLQGTEQVALPPDSDAYGSPQEAHRHAEQQAIRWVHDRSGDGQGRF